MNNNITLLCPKCGGKTHTQINLRTVLEYFPLYCPKCKQESIIAAKNGKMQTIESKSRTQ